jgi:MFS transporter, FSR family, fosmidomycin resistance protein
VAIAGILWIPGPAFYLCVALASVGLYVPFSLQVTLGQDYLPSRVGTASGITLGLTVSVGGLASPAVGLWPTPHRSRRRWFPWSSCPS